MCFVQRPILLTHFIRLLHSPWYKSPLVGCLVLRYGTDGFRVERDKHKKRALGYSRRAFINSKRVFVQGGSGGDGCIAFERIFANEKAGPSGGDGGHGGHVILQASTDITDLAHIPSIVRAENGSRGYGDNCHGANAKHTYLQVPIGTQVLLLPNTPSVGDSSNSLDNSTTFEFPKEIGRLTKDSAVFVAAHGGAGGKGNAFLTNSLYVTSDGLSSSGRNPPLRIAERGACGETRRLLLRMTQLAQIGLVGAPNAGKSTLLRCLTRARPKVAPYPFTTLKPHLGVMTGRVEESTDKCDNANTGGTFGSSDPSSLERITVADLPGLIKGAAEYNLGLGAQFLSLIADCQLLAYVIDVGTLWQQNQEESHTGRIARFTDQITQQLDMLHHELGTYDTKFTQTQCCLIVGTKMDLIVPSSASRTEFVDCLWHVTKQAVVQASVNAGLISASDTGRVLLVSARRGDNVSNLSDMIRRYVY